MEKINKARARREYNKGNEIAMLPCKAAWGSIWYTPHFVSKKSLDGMDFDKLVNSFEYYNCTSETGKYCSFYIK